MQGLGSLLTVAVLCGASNDDQAPPGQSRLLHIECAAVMPGGSRPWTAQHDRAILAEGYDYSVEGNAYRAAGDPLGYCWFFAERGRITIATPRNVSGKLYLHFLDLSFNNRGQTVAVEGCTPRAVDDFHPPEGRWLRFEVAADDTADGQIAIDVVRTAGANAVVSRIDFVPDGVAHAVIPERRPDWSSAEGMVQWDWYRQEQLRGRTPDCQQAVDDALARAEALRTDIHALGGVQAADDAAAHLAECRARRDELAQRTAAGDIEIAQWEKLYFRTRWIARRLALANPRIDFDRLLFVKRITPPIGHQCSHHVGSAQIPGADLCILEGLAPDGKVTSILDDQLPTGAIGRPDLSFDATRVVFPYAAPRDPPTAYPYGRPGMVGGACVDYQLYQVNVDGTDLAQLTEGPHENTEPCYLPDGRICFTSSRCKRFVQCGDWAIVFSLWAMNDDGSDPRPLTEAKEGEWFPSVLRDGRIIYMRWEYVIKPYNTIQYLWTVNPDGTRAQLAFGDHFAYSVGPLSFIEARQIPGTSKVVTTGAAHHNSGVGPICIVDLNRNRGDAAGLVRITPEVGYPETSEMSGTACPQGWYGAPYPLSERHFLVCYSFDTAHNAPAGYGLYLIDVHGNKELIYRDRELSCYSPIPLRPRRRPPVMPTTIASDAPAHGTAVMVDVYRGLPGVERGSVKYLRVLETVCKERHSIPQRLDVGIGAGWDPRSVLGTVPVAADGSAHFALPAGKPVFFEALDANFQDVRRMRSFVNVQPGETVGCVGCHEPYHSAPPNNVASALALRRPPDAITPPPWGAGPMSFPRVVQPVLDRHCTQCHDGGDGERKSFDLTARRMVPAKGADNQSPGPPWPSTPHLVSASFVALLGHVDFTRLDGYRGGNLPLAPFAVGSHRSKLVELLDAGHYDVQLDANERRAIVAWIDCNAPYLGNWNDYLCPTPTQQ